MPYLVYAVSRTAGSFSNFSLPSSPGRTPPLPFSIDIFVAKESEFLRGSYVNSRLIGSINTDQSTFTLNLSFEVSIFQKNIQSIYRYIKTIRGTKNCCYNQSTKLKRCDIKSISRPMGRNNNN